MIGCSLVRVQVELLSHQMWPVIRIVAMSAVTKNLTMKTLMKVTMSMKTTMTTVHHRVLRIVWSCFPFSIVQLDRIQGVLQSLWYRRLLHSKGCTTSNKLL